MVELYGYGRKINSIFQLLGNHENDITKSISWAFSKCPEFLIIILAELIPDVKYDINKIIINYQEYEDENGITDIMISQADEFNIIIEAKRGWKLANMSQLNKYAVLLDSIKDKYNSELIVSLSECSKEYVSMHIPKKILNIPIVHIPYKYVYDMAIRAKSESKGIEKKFLEELTNYLKGLISMQNQKSNEVYVVSLSENSIKQLTEEKKYFCPVGINGYPKDAPNYIAFRYFGKLQSIHHIEKYNINQKDNYMEFELFLGQAIIPSKEVKSGNIRDRRLKCALDLLLTAETVEQANKLTKERNLKIEN